MTREERLKMIIERLPHEPQLKFIGLLEMSSVDETSLKERIATNNGVVRIFVHPFYIRNHRQVQEIFPDYGVVESGLEKILTSSSKEIPPIFIFEEHQYVEKLKNLLNLIDTKEDFYLIPTERGDPTYYKKVSHLEFDSFYEITDAEDIERWKTIIEIFKKLGVKKIIIGGYVFGNKQKHGGTGCVGKTIDKLQNDFEIEISHFSHPENRTSWKKSRF